MPGTEAAKPLAVAEALPYLAKSRAVTILVIERGVSPELPVGQGSELVRYLDHHGITASVRVANEGGRDTSSALLGEIGDQKADPLVVGGYGIRGCANGFSAGYPAA